MHYFLRRLKKYLWKYFHDLHAITKGYAKHYAIEFNDKVECPYIWSNVATRIVHRMEFATLNQNRLHNMQMAAFYLDGLIIKPGEVFRFWHLLPYPKKEHGFLDGPTLLNGSIVGEAGGGLCQVSSTLFNAFLEANFEILEKHNHSIDTHGPDRFIPLGRDAAVTYGYKDLIVRNQSNVALRLSVALDHEDACFIVIVGSNSPCPFKVNIESEILEVLTPDQPDGGLGYRVKTTRHVRGNNTQSNLNYQTIELYRPYNEIHYDYTSSAHRVL